MHSRAFLLIEKELKHFKQNTPWGLEARKASEDSMFQWIVKLHGLKETDWEGGIFQLSVQFNEEFDTKPPVINFLTIPFHPNVEPTTGYLALDLLISKWTPSTHMTEVLSATQALLASPNPHLVVNEEAGDLLLHQATSYRRLTAECVRVSQRLDEECGGVEKETEADLVYDASHVRIEYSPEQEARRLKEKLSSNSTDRPLPPVARVNFEDYLATWNGIATSKSSENQVNSHLQLIERNSKLISVHHCLPLEDIETQLVQQMEQHRSLTYGNITKKPKVASARDNKAENLEKISLMRKMYISQRAHSNISRAEHTQLDIDQTPAPINSAREDDLDPDHADKDVDDLVAWTQDLDASNV